MNGRFPPKGLAYRAPLWKVRAEPGRFVKSVHMAVQAVADDPRGHDDGRSAPRRARTRLSLYRQIQRDDSRMGMIG